MGRRSKLTPSRFARTQAVSVYSEPGFVAQPSWAMPTWSAEPFEVRRSAREPAGHMPSEPSSVDVEMEPPSPLLRKVPEDHAPDPMEGSMPPRVMGRVEAGAVTPMPRTSIQSPSTLEDLPVPLM